MKNRSLRNFFACAAIAALVFSGWGRAEAIVYHGAPDLELAARLVQAGSNEHGFNSHVLFERLYGDNATTEGAKLVQRYGEHHVATFFPMLNYAIADIVRLATTVAHAKIPAVSPKQDPVTLQRDLIRAGTTPDGRYDVGYMIERMMTHPLHHDLMRNLDGVYGPANNAAFHEILGSVVTGKIDGPPSSHMEMHH